MVVMFDKKIAW